MNRQPRTRASLKDESERRRHSLLHGYVPPETIVVDPSLQFSTEVTPDLDMVTYEVIRSKLWNLNIDHGDTIRRLSGSNVVVEGFDFNVAITTEVGDAVAMGAYSMFFAGFADEVIKWTLEHRSMNVGIREGDIWLQDDPWVGTNHQMDVAIYAPVFHDGKLFAWIFNCLHQREIGGSVPGGFVPHTNDVYLEATFMPPIRLAENNRVREDLVDMWVRRSRLPELMVLELNSQVAGVRFAQKRLIDMIERYGAPTVKAAMYKMIDSTSRAVASRFRQLPDGMWRDERYFAGAEKEKTKLHKVCLTFDKRGDRLRASNEGTESAIGSFNITRGVFRATILNGLQPTFGYDQYLCAAGILKQLDFDYAQGSITSASHPSAVSSSLGTLISLTQAHSLGSKMASGNVELARHCFASAASHTAAFNGLHGTDQYGRPYTDLPLDVVTGGVGGFNFRDGIDHGGPIYAVAGPIPDVEKCEQHIPLLFLYRKELPDSGGHGKWRGGACLVVGWVGHKTEDSYVASGGLCKSVTQGIGIAGGYPGSGGYNWYAADTKIQAGFKDGRLPGSPAETHTLAPHGGLADINAYNNRLCADDIFEALANPAGGWGDPLLRDMNLVADDVGNRRLSAAEAKAIYGVVLSKASQADPQATAEARKALREKRIAAARPPRKPRTGTADTAGCPHAIECVAIIGDKGKPLSYACSCCGQNLGPTDRTYRSGCAELDTDLTAIGPYFMAPEDETGEELVMRSYVCPRCAVLIDTVICRPEDEPYEDVVIRSIAGL